MSGIAGVIAAKNQRDWIEASVASLRAEVDELVVVDDGSTDGTAELLGALSTRLEFTVIDGASGGVSNAYNLAIDAVDSPVVLIQGGDDIAVPGRGAASAKALEDPSVVLVHSAPTVIDANGRILPSDAAGEFGVSDPDDPVGYLFTVGNFICAPSVAVRRGDYVAHGGFPVGIDLLQDYALWLELASVGRFHRSSAPLVEYRKHATNLSREYQGPDSPRRRRHAAEMSWVRNRFVDRATLETLRRLGPVWGEPGGRDLDRDDRALLLRLGSADRSLVRRGLSDLFDRMVSDGVPALHRLGLSRTSLDELALIADYDNTAELGAARATLERLSSLAGIRERSAVGGR